MAKAKSPTEPEVVGKPEVIPPANAMLIPGLDPSQVATGDEVDALIRQAREDAGVESFYTQDELYRMYRAAKPLFIVAARTEVGAKFSQEQCIYVVLAHPSQGIDSPRACVAVAASDSGKALVERINEKLENVAAIGPWYLRESHYKNQHGEFVAYHPTSAMPKEIAEDIAKRAGTDEAVDEDMPF